MILRLLTRGKTIKLAVALIWTFAIFNWYLGIKGGNTSTDNFYVALFIGTGNAFFYYLIATRLMLLTQNDMSKVIPNYFYYLKKSLLGLLGISLLPTLMVLPNIESWLSLIAISIMLAVFMVAITYRPLLILVFIFLFFVKPWNWLINYFELPDIDISVLSAFALPAIALGAYWLLGRLECFTKDSKDLKKVKLMMNAKQASMIVPSHKIPLKFQNRLVQWFAKSNLQHFKKRIESAKPMTNKQLIAISCQGEYSVGPLTYLLWLGAAMLFLLSGNQIDKNFSEFFSTSILAVPLILVVLSSISFFQVVSSKQSLLKRLAVMPCFNDKQRFSTAFINYVLEEQLKLYVFMSLILVMFSYIFENFTSTLLINSLVVSLMVSLFNVAIMLWAWTMEKRIDSLAVWLMFTFMIGSSLLLVFVVNFNVLLWEKSTFIVISLFILSLFSVNVFNCYRKNSRCI